MRSTTSARQKRALEKPCPLCGQALRVLGDLADFKHDMVACTDDACDYVLLFNGETIQ